MAVPAFEGHTRVAGKALEVLLGFNAPEWAGRDHLVLFVDVDRAE